MPNLQSIVGSRTVKALGRPGHPLHWNEDAFTDGQIIDTITPHATTRKDLQARMTRAEPVWDPASHPRHWRAVWGLLQKRPCATDAP